MADAKTKGMLRERVTTILRSAPTKKIDFRLRQWHIDSNSFGKVADAIELEIVDVDLGVTGGALAQYNYGNDTIGFPNESFGTTPFDRAVIVHECVHAYIDSFAEGRITVSANEAAGWVAYRLHVLNSAASVPTDRSADPSKPHPDEVALRIANQIMNTPGATVTPTDEQDLRTAIVNHPAYASRGINLGTQRVTDGWSREYSAKIASKFVGPIGPWARLFPRARQWR